jgi:acetolactate synthase-1/2/3 large subunit
LIGRHIRDPAPDLATLARSLGLRGHGPVTGQEGLEAVLATATEQALAGEAVLVDVHVAAPGPAV